MVRSTATDTTASDQQFVERRPSPENRFRLRGVHYFQRGWPYTFWDALRVSDLDRDFAEIRGYGFNTIVLFQSWGKFQTRMNPATYDDAAFHKLDAVISAAKRHGLWVVLRVGTPESVPSDMPNARLNNIPDLMFEDGQIEAMAALFRETSRRIGYHKNVYGLFNSWEDFSQYLNYLGQGEVQRREFEDRKGYFRRYLKERGTLESWNTQWGTRYASFEEIPLPAAGTAALATYIDFASEHVRSKILGKLTASEGVDLGYEPRLDKEPVLLGGKPSWKGSEKSYQLPPQYTFVAAYYNPFWGAPNDGGFITPGFAEAAIKRMLSEIEDQTRLPVFVEQLNLADDTPAFTRTNSKLRYPDDEVDAVHRIVPLLFRRSIGYSLWTFQDYVGNILADAHFLENRGAWTHSAPASFCPAPHGEKELHLANGASLTQSLYSHVNPGSITGVPFRFDVEAAIAGEENQVDAAASLRITIVAQDGKEATRTLNITGTKTRRYSTRLPEVGMAPTRISLKLEDESKAVHLRQARLWNHLMATGLVDDNGHQRRSRVLAYRAENQRWQEVEDELALPAHFDTVLTGEQCGATCWGVFPDGWAGPQVAISLYVPLSRTSVRLTTFIPEALVAGGESLRLIARWGDAPPDDPGTSFVLRTGHNEVDVPSQAGHGDPKLGDRFLYLETNRAPTAADDGRALAFRLVKVGLDPSLVSVPGEVQEGLSGLRLTETDGNRVRVRGKATGKARFEVSVAARGHPESVTDVTAPGVWDLTVPLWKERLEGRPDLYLFVRRLEGDGKLVVDGLSGESERTPNTIYE